MFRRLHPSGYPAHFSNEMDRVFDAFFGGWPFGEDSGTVFPPVNVWEGEDKLYLEAELPGSKKEDLDISLLGQQLVLKGQRKGSAEDEGRYHRRERLAGTFHRVIRLPYPVEGQEVEAALKDGILTLTLSKATAARPRKIDVKLIESKNP